MNSVRPLATITILTVVGVFLFMKINEGPQFSSEATSDTWDTSPPAFGETGGGEASTAGGMTAGLADASSASAPAWSPQPATESTVLTPEPPETTTAVTTPPVVTTEAASDTALPAVPSIPELPPLAGSTAAGTQPATTTLPLPANIPMARYPDSPTAAETAEPQVSGQVPSLGTSTADLAPSAPPATGATTPPPTPGEAGNATAATTPIEDGSRLSAFSAARPVIDTALERGELPRAHLLLSQWRGDESLTPEERNEVETLLNQLAGTVIYSNEHRLEPAYVVQAGDTLETIAKAYNVPWQLLAKINGIARADAIEPGQQLKVVRGPFMAEINLSQQKLTLEVDGRYAGKFAIRPADAATINTGEWVVKQKVLNPVTQGITQASTAYADPAPTVQRALVLGSVATTSASTLVVGPGTGQPAVPDAAAAPAIQVSATDADDLCDILSVGSRVVIRR